MKTKEILILEDINSIEIDVRNRLEELGYHVQNILLSAKDAFESIEKNPPDIVLLDINLEGNKNGIDTAREIQEKYNIPVLFLSGETNKKTLKKLAETKAYGFVSKPFQEAVLFANIEMALVKHKNSSTASSLQNFPTDQTTAEKTLNDHFIFIRSDYKLKKLNLKDILFVEALKDYVVINTKDKKYKTHTTMKKMMQALPDNQFIRVHRSYIVRFDKIYSVKYPDLTIEDQRKVIPVGGLYKNRLFDKMNII